VRITSTALPATAVLTLLLLVPPIPADAAVSSSATHAIGAMAVGSETTSTAADFRSATSSAAHVADAVQEEPAPEAEAGRFAFVLIPLVAAAVVVVGAIVVISRGRRRRRGD
jgi:hypothetical protein